MRELPPLVLALSLAIPHLIELVQRLFAQQQADNPLIDLLGAASDAGIVTLVLLALVGGSRRWWVWGWQYTELQIRRDREQMDLLAERDHRLAEKDTEIAWLRQELQACHGRGAR